MAPPKRLTRPLTVRIPEDLWLELHLLHTSTTGRNRYRIFGRMIESALREWMEQQKVAKP